MMPYWARVDVAVGPAHQVAHEVLDVAAHVAGLGELGGVGLDERHADQVGDAADEVGFADAGRAEQDDVLLGVVGLVLALEGQPHVVVVVAQGHAQDFLGLVLLDDEAVEVSFDVARFVFKGKQLLPRLGSSSPASPEVSALAWSGEGLVWNSWRMRSARRLWNSSGLNGMLPKLCFIP